MRENRMFNVIIFLLGAGIMFFMALRSVLARRRLCTQGQKVTATVEGLSLIHIWLPWRQG